MSWNCSLYVEYKNSLLIKCFGAYIFWSYWLVDDIFNFPLRLQGCGLSIAGLVIFGTNALLAFAFSPLQTWLGAGIMFFIFWRDSSGVSGFNLFIVPETKGIILHEIEAIVL